MVGLDRAERDPTASAALLERADTLWLFYSAVLASKPEEQRGHYRDLRIALEDVWNTLCGHPALKTLRAVGNEREEFLVRLPNIYQSTRPMNLVSGLMARAENLPEDGCRSAGRELNALLDPDGRAGTPDKFGYLAAGHHVALFHGLRFEGAVAIGYDMSIVPSRHIDAFVHERVSRGLGPEIVGSIAAQSSCAVVKPFVWTPEFLMPGAEGCLDLDWGGSFREDAEAFIELLAVMHGSAAVCLLTAHYCIHRTAACLLGRPGFTGEWTWGRSARSFDRLAQTREYDIAALDEARKTFLARHSARYRVYAPVISRLAEALARSGQFAVEDRILDVAIALERMYELDQGSISRKLRNRASRFLGSDAGSGGRDWESVKELYEVRSDIVHNRWDRLSAQRTRKASEKGIDVARRSLFKFLREGPPDDWNALAVHGS